MTKAASTDNRDANTADAPTELSIGLQHFPVAFFAVSMGLWGWALAMWAGAAHIETLMPVAVGLRAIATIAFIAILGTYGLKALRNFAACRAEWAVPPRLAFFPAISISVLLVSMGFLPSHPDIAAILWPVGAALQGVLTLAVISSWISHRAFETGQLSPAWFIPAVGNVIVPIAGAPLGYIDLSWLFLSGGLIFWIVLLTLVMNRLMFHNPMPGKLLPTLVILIAPPALAFQAYVALVGTLDPFARILVSAAYVFALLVLIQLPRFRHLPFALSWWALSFPLAALATASFKMAEVAGKPIYNSIGFLVLAVLSVAVVALCVKTLRGLLNGVFWRPEV
ncbi:SLAC1 anion channel family protein [Cognatishimia maritima]|uniref:Tellurite resistance protein n=1 Tax=Cognatishimia maritima TaxID=870908 RepID=A0A1M5I842_9RHOB|nr:SLAC1 anion channel family protein [Cognatishimia maritima]SHG23943.1 tellurite resistance protein [Cognatishimia maritima]